MAYSTATDIQSRVPGIATSETGAKGFVQRLVMQTPMTSAASHNLTKNLQTSGKVCSSELDVLESQGRSALLPDAVISTILSQLNVVVTYTPLMCPKVHLKIPDDMTMRGIKY
ncbi:hypothetical protein KIN20_031557 [Parelaphostrongylus tenuis]|uniref:Uncharacterized protein n=1 Tax=Parelaphostrongylus tenuis TaxID=148309 RepID=A0AAD5R5A2_PARTN|nr:hypothetical protein KIN20_031557 [Parelaphostrongylus tenuis]